MTLEYAIVIEPSSNGFGAYVPDLPGCVAVGESQDEVRALIREAIGFHLEALREDGQAAPVPVSRVDYIRVAQAA